MTRGEEYRRIRAQYPDLCRREIAKLMGITPEYCGLLARRAGESLKSKRRTPESASADAIAEREAAERQADAIVSYWASLGYTVTATVREKPFCAQSRCRPCEVITDLVNGLPRGFRAGDLPKRRVA
jgi:hypothetical protein